MKSLIVSRQQSGFNLRRTPAATPSCGDFGKDTSLSEQILALNKDEHFATVSLKSKDENGQLSLCISIGCRSPIQTQSSTTVWRGYPKNAWRVKSRLAGLPQRPQAQKRGRIRASLLRTASHREKLRQGEHFPREEGGDAASQVSGFHEVKVLKSNCVCRWSFENTHISPETILHPLGTPKSVNISFSTKTGSSGTFLVRLMMRKMSRKWTLSNILRARRSSGASSSNAGTLLTQAGECLNV